MSETIQTANAAASKLPKGKIVTRLVAIAIVAAGSAALFAFAGGWLTPHVLTPARFVNTFEHLNGVHPGFRRNHAKGVCVSGHFDSNGQGVELCKASVFQSGRVPLIGRFSLSGGDPHAADAATTVRGFGLQFQLAESEEWRIAVVNLPVFPENTPQAFHDLLLATAPNPATGKPDMDKIQAFVKGHPEFVKAKQVLDSHPMSSAFDNTTFNSLNAFHFVSASGAVASVRWSLVPVQPFAPINASETASTNKNQLFDALIAGIHKNPLQWRMIVTVAHADDPTDDATIPWPSDRRQIEVGTITIDHVESDDTSPARDITFDPTILPNGIAVSGDPLLSARAAVYSQSLIRRDGERKESAFISPDETGK